MPLIDFRNASIAQRYAKMTGEGRGIRVFGIDLVADLARKSENGLIADSLLGELPKAGPPIEEANRHAKRRTEFRGVGRWRRVFC